MRLLASPSASAIASKHYHSGRNDAGEKDASDQGRIPPRTSDGGTLRIPFGLTSRGSAGRRITNSPGYDLREITASMKEYGFSEPAVVRGFDR